MYTLFHKYSCFPFADVPAVTWDFIDDNQQFFCCDTVETDTDLNKVYRVLCDTYDGALAKIDDTVIDYNDGYTSCTAIEYFEIIDGNGNFVFRSILQKPETDTNVTNVTVTI